MKSLLFVSLLCLTAGFASAGEVREWTDAAERNRVGAELVDFDETHCVLKRESDHRLFFVLISDLSSADQTYLRSEEAIQIHDEAPESYRKWTFKDGSEVVGQVAEYVQDTVSISRNRGILFVNETDFDEASTWEKCVTLGVVSFQADEDIDSKSDLEQWLVRHRRTQAQFEISGVELNLRGGFQISAPFHIFSQSDQSVLRPGWEDWLAAQAPSEDEEESLANSDHDKDAVAHEMRLYLRSCSRISHQERQLNMYANQILIQDAWGIPRWRVNLIPKPGTNAYPTQVAIAANSSARAWVVAANQYPYHQVAGVGQFQEEDQRSNGYLGLTPLNSLPGVPLILP